MTPIPARSGHRMRIVGQICYSCGSSDSDSVSSDFSFLASDLSVFAWSRSAFFVALDFSRWERSNL